MREDTPARVELVVETVVVEVGELRGVDVGEAVQAAAEVGGVLVGSEHGAKRRVEHHLRVNSVGGNNAVQL